MSFSIFMLFHPSIISLLVVSFLLHLKKFALLHMLFYLHQFFKFKNNLSKIFTFKYFILSLLHCVLLNFICFIQYYSPVSWGCRIQRLHLYGEVPPPHNECPRYDIKQFDRVAPIMLELWGMWSTSSLPLLQGLLYESNRTVRFFLWVI